MLSARSCARRAAWGVLLLLSGAGSALDIASPREAQTVVARAGAGDTSVRVHVDLGADVRVPEHGILALYLDGTRVLLACPGSVASAADCPTEGAPLSGRISLGLGSMPSGEHVLSAELLDAGMAPLAIARRVFTYVEEAEEDNLLPEGMCCVGRPSAWACPRGCARGWSCASRVQRAGTQHSANERACRCTRLQYDRVFQGPRVPARSAAQQLAGARPQRRDPLRQIAGGHGGYISFVCSERKSASTFAEGRDERRGMRSRRALLSASDSACVLTLAASSAGVVPPLLGQVR